MSDEIPTSIRINKVKKGMYVDFGKKHGYNTLSKLITASVDTCMRNPSLLQPTENTQSVEILESLEKSFSVFDDLTVYLGELSGKIEELQRFQEWTVKKLGGTEKDVKQIKNIDTSGEEVFEK